jgi:hypothetical protein
MAHACRRLAIGIGVLAWCAIAVSAQADKIDVSGKWLFTVETSIGSGTPNIALKQEGEKLTGHYSGQLGEADLTGSVKGTDVTFAFTVDAQGVQLACIYRGNMDGKDSMKGTMDIAGVARGTFTAKRQ